MVNKRSCSSSDIATASLSSKKRVSKSKAEEMGKKPSSCEDDKTVKPFSSSKKRVSKPKVHKMAKGLQSNNIVAPTPPLSSKKRKLEPSDPIDSDPDDDMLDDTFSDEEEEVVQVNEYSLIRPNNNEQLTTKKKNKNIIISGKNNKCSEQNNSQPNSEAVLSIPIPLLEARQRWPHRYQKDGEDVAKCHYRQAKVNDTVFNLEDDAYVVAEDENSNYIAKIVEFFESADKQLSFTARWYYRAVDTVIEAKVIKEHSHLFDNRRVFYSDITDVNPIECLISKLNIQRVSSTLMKQIELSEVVDCDYYCDMSYSVPYSTFSSLPTGELQRSSSTISRVGSCDGISSEMTLLDLYSGCGAMSTGLCLGAARSNVNLVTRWAVDVNVHACESLEFNHPEANVRNESAEDFLFLLKNWAKLCEKFCLHPDLNSKEDEGDDDEDCDESADVFEVEKLLDVCYGDPNKLRKKDIYFKVRWKGYDKSYDTWEPIDNMSTCPDKLKEFVIEGHKSKLLPLPGQVHVVCGGPPCQGVSGHNRFRNYKKPLDDPKNMQLIVFMDIVEYLKPNYVLMENVTDILKFVDGYLGRYAIGRLVAMKYQTRLGLMVAGCYGLPQYRMRAFFWGALPYETLPQFPLPTHLVIGRGSSPRSFEVVNGESQDERPYEVAAKTDFQKEIRKPKSVASDKPMLFDHFPYKLNVDDYQRGANFRMLPGVMVDKDNRAYLDPKKERLFLPSKKPLVPDYALTFVKGKSPKPFGRLWWDEIVSTVVTRPEPHNQVILHPEQDRVLSIRENARLQGFPDYYKLFGPEKERYIQVGNAVAIPVACALGYALGVACQKISDDEPVVSLPPKPVIEDADSEVLE
ncbi:DNA (cytosine-5)-methyltransferase [Thalictrum thalictroides]|uniref:DNA (cytosine-5-)-methyltransferase n=1 Tax=Thalictrum thalictroides TaxID=46969 RepID=A0A7J6VZN8_THATH|nr:DNA (cytosine-5)-methyltransferase [Thalictrum thalictroides]